MQKNRILRNIFQGSCHGQNLFFSHNGSSNGANSVNRVAELAKGATVLADDALSLRGSNVADSEKEVKDWAQNVTKAK